MDERQPISPPPVGGSKSPKHRRKKITALVITGIIIALLLGGGYYWWSQSNGFGDKDKLNKNASSVNDGGTGDDSSDGTGDSDSGNGDAGKRYVGTWILESEKVNSPAGDITSNGTGTTFTIMSGGTAEEDYSSTTGYGDCTVSGKITGAWSASGDSIVFDHANAVKADEPRIECGAGAGTSAVTRSVIAFAYDTNHDWVLTLSDNDQTLTAVISAPEAAAGLKVTQVYKKK